MKRTWIMIIAMALAATACQVTVQPPSQTQSHVAGESKPAPKVESLEIVKADGTHQVVLAEEFHIYEAAEKAAKTYMTKEEVMNYKGCGCGYIAGWNMPVLYDRSMKVSDGVAYDGGIFPILERKGGVIKSVMRGSEYHGDGGKYVVVFLRETELEHNWRNTCWGATMHNYKVSPAVPQLCGVPKTRKR